MEQGVSVAHETLEHRAKEEKRREKKKRCSRLYITCKNPETNRPSLYFILYVLYAIRLYKVHYGINIAKKREDS